MTRTVVSWIAIAVILMAALAPSISRAVGTAAGSSWLEVYRAEGSPWAGSETARDRDPARGVQHAIEHCPYCSTHPNLVGFPPAPLLAIQPGARSHAVPLAFLFAPHTLHAWRSAQPRAPPLSLIG